MGRFDLTERESHLLLGLARAGEQAHETEFVLRTLWREASLEPLVHGNSGEALAVDSTTPADGNAISRSKPTVFSGFPGDLNCYLDLMGRGYLFGRQNGQNWIISLTKLASDYVAYARRSRFGRWYQDIAWDLGHDDTLRSKVIWAVVTYLLAVVTGVVLHVLGVA
jgi:hypothetical protein